MSNEGLRNDLVLQLERSGLNVDQIKQALGAFDVAVSDYDVTRKSHDIIPYNDQSQIVGLYLASMSLGNASKNTISAYRLEITKFFEFVKKPYTDIKPNDIRMYLYEKKVNGKCCDSSLDLKRRTLSAFFQWLTDNEYILRNPVRIVEKIKVHQEERQPLESIDVETLRWACIDDREKAIIDFLYSTGCRVSECASVKLTDINWANRSVIIHHGKGDKERIVYFNAEAELSIKLYIKNRKGESDALFAKTKYPFSNISKRAIERIINTIWERSKISARCTPHVLRHTFATTCIQHGMPLETLQELMGHSKPETTMIYAKLNNEHTRMEHSRIFN